MAAETHRGGNAGWLRAAVLGANDGILSTSSLILGVAAAHGSHGSIVVAGLSGLVAGAMSMAAGEYVSVHSQEDTETADTVREKAEQEADPEGEHAELTTIYVRRGLDEELARQVADQLMAHDALGAHQRDELGITEELKAKPVQAAMASAASFAVGAVLPLIASIFLPASALIFGVAAASLVFLAVLGALAAQAGGAPVGRSVVRVVFWGALAMAVTAGIGALFGTTV